MRPSLPAQASAYLDPAAFAFYGAILVALIGAVLSPVVQARIEREADAARAERESEHAELLERAETGTWLRGQVTELQGTVQTLQRQFGEQGRQLDHLRQQMRQRDNDDTARDGRIAQLEGALRAASFTVPPPLPDYARLLDREGFRRPRREE